MTTEAIQHAGLILHGNIANCLFDALMAAKHGSKVSLQRARDNLARAVADLDAALEKHAPHAAE